MQALKSNKLIIMFILLVILIILMACWISDRLITHLDNNMPGF